MAAPPTMWRASTWARSARIDNGIVAVSTVWANEAHYEPLHLMPYTPAVRLAQGRQDRAFRTKTQIALSLVEQAQAAGIPFKAIVSDSFYGDNQALQAAFIQHCLPFVLAHRGTFGRGWAPAEAAHSFNDAAKALPLRAWRAVQRRFRDGHTERWWAAELTLFSYGPNKPVRAVCATTERRALPALSAWYLTTNLPAPSAPLKEIVRLYGLRNWVEQSYKQMKGQLGWADFMVRRDRAIRRHWTLVFCAFTFCGWQAALQAPSSQVSAPPEVPKKNQPQKNRQPQGAVLLAAPAARRALMVDPGPRASALLGRLYRYAPAR